jgi:uncharacterized RDD family membrane protein YckC
MTTESLAHDIKREGVAPAGFVRYGGFWLRFVALLIDGFIIGIPIYILRVYGMGLSMTQIAQYPNPQAGIIWLLVLISTALACAYEAFFLVRFGATPGKMALGLKVVRPDGSGITAGRAIGRYFARSLSGMILYIGFIMAGFDAQKRALHDRICDTRVIKTR